MVFTENGWDTAETQSEAVDPTKLWIEVSCAWVRQLTKKKIVVSMYFIIDASNLNASFIAPFSLIIIGSEFPRDLTDDYFA